MKLSVAEIETMYRAALITAWDEVFGTPVPKRLSNPFLRRFLAFEVQTQIARACPKDLLAGWPKLRGMIRLPRLLHSSQAAV